MVASVVAEVEVARAVRRRGVTTEVGERARSLVAACYLVEVSDEIRARAASLTLLSLRALDAIHVASALTADVTGFFTFDVRQQVAAEESGLAVVSV